MLQDYGAAPTNFAMLLLALLLSFVLGHSIAWAYMVTHSGLSYSRSYVNTLVLMPVIVCMVMMILSNNLVLAFGLMAIFAMVRYRSILRDTLDTAFVLAVIVVGLACGTGKFASGIISCVATIAIMFYLKFTGFGTRARYDLILNVQWIRPAGELDDLRHLLDRHSRETVCASQRSNEGYPGIDISYRLLMRDPARVQDLLEELRSFRGVSRVSSLHAGDESEI